VNDPAAHLVAQLNAWLQKGRPTYLAILLSHLYSDSSLSAKTNFKGRDGALVGVLLTAILLHKVPVVLLQAQMTRKIDLKLNGDSEEVEDDEDITDDYEFIDSLTVTTGKPKLLFPAAATAKDFPMLPRVLRATHLTLGSDVEHRAPLLMMGQSWSSIRPSKQRDQYTGNEGVDRHQQFERTVVIVVPQGGVERFAVEVGVVNKEETKKGGGAKRQGAATKAANNNKRQKA
jgi:hypothetical protein